MAVPDFADLYRELHPRLVASLAAFCGDADLAAEAADEAAVKAIERWDRVSAMGNPQGWLFRVAVNEVRRRQRRRDLERRVLLRSIPPTPVPGPAGEIWAVVAALSPRQREAVALRHVAGMSEPEIAEVMGVARGTVSSTLRAAYAQLRAATAEDRPPPTVPSTGPGPCPGAPTDPDPHPAPGPGDDADRRRAWS